MKPINNNQEGCSPISSNCVIWQGPDIDCINLCKGDTVTDVVYKLASELCEILDSVDVSAYDLSCLNLQQQSPATFQQLIQLLIDKICFGSGNTSRDVIPSSGCPDDCFVTVAPCLQTTDGAGNPITILPIKEYVEKLGSRLCEIVLTLNEMQAAINNHETRIVTLENAVVPQYTPPTVTPVCVTNNPGTPQEMNVVLTELETAFCNLRSLIGDDTQLTTAINAMCAQLSTASSLLNPNVTMQDLSTSWTAVPSTAAEALTNAWITICDLRNAVTYILENCCDTSCASLDIDVRAEMLSTTQVRLVFSGNIPSVYADTNTGSSIVITDTVNGNSMTINSIALISLYFSTSSPYVITLANGVNGANNLTVNTTLRATDPELGNECVINDQTVAVGVDACPTLNIAPSFEEVEVQFTWSGQSPQPMVAKIYDAAGINVIASINYSASTGANSFTIANLTSGTDYKFELVIGDVPCPQQDFTTLSYPCNPPTNVSATVQQEQPA